MSEKNHTFETNIFGNCAFFFQLSVDGMFMYHHLTRNKFFYELRKRFSDMNCFCCLLFGVFVYILNEFKKKISGWLF